MRKVDDLRIKVMLSRRKIFLLRLREANRKLHFKREWNHPEGYAAYVLVKLENSGSCAHDECLSELSRLKTLVRMMRGAELQATIYYEEAENRVHD